MRAYSKSQHEHAQLTSDKMQEEEELIERSDEIQNYTEYSSN